jgi:hypothetical protein
MGWQAIKERLRRLFRRHHWQYIVWHTAAHGNPRTGEVYDTTAAQIDAWHKAQGWQKIGYHFVVRLNGDLETGRELDEIGAHVEGLNHRAIGICFSGHGDLQPLTDAQVQTGVNLTVALCKAYHIPVSRVLGHRECAEILKRPLFKTCPGKLVDMRVMRVKIQEVLNALQE